MATLSAEGGDDLVRRRLSGVADASLVSDAQDKNPGALDGATRIIEGFADEAQHVGGHRAVDLVGQGDESCLIAIETHLPGEVEGVHRDAVPADPWTRVEGHETEGL